MPDPGTVQLYNLARRLRDAGTEGQGLRRQLRQAITGAAEDLAKTISDVEHLKPYLPDRYAVILAEDLAVRTATSFSGDPKVSIRAQARERKRKIKRLDQGYINHPIWARGERKTWHWQTGQTGGMRPGFFTDPARDAAPEIKDRVMQAIAETARRIGGGA